MGAKRPTADDEPQPIMPELFGRTPGADAYTRQLAELRGYAAKSARMAEEAAASTENARALCRRAKDLAVDMAERQREFVATAEKTRQTAVFVCACAVLVLIIEIIRVFI